MTSSAPKQLSPTNHFAARMEDWLALKPYPDVTLTNRVILEDNIKTMELQLKCIQPHLLPKAEPITVGLLTEVAAGIQSNIRWLKTILERSPKPQQKAEA